MKTELALREFLDSRISSNLSPRTIEWYEDRLRPFAKSCPDLPRRPEPIEGFLASVQGSPEPKRDTFNALRTFFRFICKRHRIPNPMDAINPPRRPKTRMATLEGFELVKLLGLVEDLRDRAILTLLGAGRGGYGMTRWHAWYWDGAQVSLPTELWGRRFNKVQFIGYELLAEVH